MSSITESPLLSERVAAKRLWWIGLLAMTASVIANLAVRVIALAVFEIPSQFVPLAALGQIIVFTVLGVWGAVGVFAVIARFTQRPISVFRIIAVVVLLLSFVPDFLLLAAKERLPFPGTSLQSVGSLMFMHVVTAVITVALLTTLAREK